MQHVAFVIFAIIFVLLVAYAMFQYGLPPKLNLGSVQYQTVTSTQTLPAQRNTAASGNSSQAVPKQSSGSGATIKSQQRNTAIPSSPPPQAGTSSPTGFYGQVNVNPSQIPAGFSIRDISPYFGYMRISASPGSPGFHSQISLYSSLPTSGGPLNVTGWLIRGNRGSIYVPKAIDVYEPSGFAPERDIFMKNGDTLTIYSTVSALGVNIRMNKCIGYLANTRQFSPPIFASCPFINRSDIINFTGQCQNYILSLGSCQMPAPNPPVPFNDFACQAYLDQLNYAGCVAKHRSDFDFLSNQWNIWSGTQFLDFSHDRLLLFDRQGLVVAEYNY